METTLATEGIRAGDSQLGMQRSPFLAGRSGSDSDRAERSIGSARPEPPPGPITHGNGQNPQGAAQLHSHFAGPGTAQRSAIQFYGGATSVPAAGEATAESGMSSPAELLPYLDLIQRSFGRHRVTSIAAHSGSQAQAAANQLGAKAYASREHAVFGAAPDLHTAAHEAAHIVQQRSGLTLAGGMGQKGDAHERHADAVADRVVRGESAEDLLDQYGQTNEPSAAGASDAPVQCQDSDQLEDVLTAVAGAYKWICMEQSNAVRDLGEDAEKADEPSFWEAALWACADIALAAALGGVGGLVAAKVLDKLKKAGVTDAAAKVVADMMKDASKATAKQLLPGMKNTATTKDQRVLFFRSQRDVLQRTAKTQEEKFTISGKQIIRKSANPMKQALALQESLNDNYESAYNKQKFESLDAWCVYQAKAALNNKSSGPDKGTDLSEQVGDTSEAGVLGINIRAINPGQKPEIVSAEIEGLNQGLRSLIESRPIGALKIPITVKGEVFEDIGWGRKWIGKESQPTIAIGKNEQGTIWVDTSRYHGLYWLQKRAVPHPQQAWDGQGRIHDQFPAGAEFTGARLLIEEDMKNLSVRGKLSG